MAIIKSELSEGLQLSIKALSNNVLALNKNIVTLNKNLSKDSSKDGMDMENAREQKSLFARIANYLKTLSESSSNKGDSKDTKLGVGFTGIAVALGLLYGYIKKYVAVFGQGLKTVLKALDFKLFNGAVTKAIAKMVSSVANFATKMGKLFTESKGFKAVKWLVTKVKAFFGAIMNVAKYIGNFLGRMFKMVGKVVSFFKTITGGFSSFMGVFSKFAVLASRLFFPITVIIGLVEGLFKAFERYKTDGIIGGVLGFFEGVINGIIMKPLDILKDLASWIAEKLGFEQFAELLDSFSFEEMFSGLIDGILNIGEYFTKALEWVKDKFKSVKDALTFWKNDEDEPKEMEPKSTPAVEKKTTIAEPKPEPEVVVAAPKTQKKKPIDDFKGFEDEYTEIHENESMSKGEKVRALSKLRTKVRDAKASSDEAWYESGRDAVTGDTIYTNKYTNESKNVAPGMKTAPKNTADQVATASSEAEMAKSSVGSKGNSAIVNAPSTTINSATNNNLVKPAVRNVDPSLNSYYKQKYI